MASNKQLEANRTNAKNSTGPRSQAGKARSSLNSRKHGLTAKTLIIVGENAEDLGRCGQNSWMNTIRSQPWSAS